MSEPDVLRPRVLLVEDDTRTGRRLAQMLREDGYDVEFAADGAAAIASLARSPLPDVLVTDLNLPLVDGMAVTRYARSRAPGLPVLVVTGNPNLLRDGNAPLDPKPLVMTKPLDYDLLTRMVRAATHS